MYKLCFVRGELLVNFLSPAAAVERPHGVHVAVLFALLVVVVIISFHASLVLI